MFNLVRSSFARFAIMAAFGAGLASSAKADFFSFDADGAGGSASAQTITGLTYGSGNALARGAITPGVGLTVGSTFTVYFQTHLTELATASGTNITPNGLNSSYQITLVASLTETVTSLTTVNGITTANFSLVPNASDRINIYFNNGVVYNNATGAGFTAGTVIASLSPSSFINSTFGDTTSLLGTTQFNTVGTGNGLGSTTNQGSGSTGVAANVNSYNSSFFQPPTGNPLLTSSLVNLGVDPKFDVIPASVLFTNPLTNASFAASIGSNNGTSGPDFQLEVSGFTQAFTVVPEPASVAMTLLGLGGVSFGSIVARRRRANASA